MNKRVVLLSCILLGWLGVFSSHAQNTGMIRIDWMQPCDARVVGYTLRFGGQAIATPKTNFIPEYTDCGINFPAHTNIVMGIYTNTIIINNITTTNYVISNLVCGTTYYVGMTTMDAAGNESRYSEEASYTIPFHTNTPPMLRFSLP